MDQTGGADTMILTGGTGGIGRAIAEKATARGWAVCIGYAHDDAAADAVLTMLRQQGARAHAVRCDVADEDDVAHLFDEAARARSTLTEAGRWP